MTLLYGIITWLSVMVFSAFSLLSIFSCINEYYDKGITIKHFKNGLLVIFIMLLCALSMSTFSHLNHLNRQISYYEKITPIEKHYYSEEWQKNNKPIGPVQND